MLRKKRSEEKISILPPAKTFKFSKFGPYKEFMLQKICSETSNVYALAKNFKAFCDVQVAIKKKRSLEKKKEILLKLQNQKQSSKKEKRERRNQSKKKAGNEESEAPQTTSPNETLSSISNENAKNKFKTTADQIKKALMSNTKEGMNILNDLKNSNPVQKVPINRFPDKKQNERNDSKTIMVQVELRTESAMDQSLFTRYFTKDKEHGTTAFYMRNPDDMTTIKFIDEYFEELYSLRVFLIKQNYDVYYKDTPLGYIIHTSDENAREKYFLIKKIDAKSEEALFESISSLGALKNFDIMV